MTLTQMRYFFEVCQWQNITKAAEHLHVSQPTISVAMRTMEEETGLNLFHREGRKLVMTPEGSKLFAKINHILSQIDQLEVEVQDMAQNRNHIRMALPLQIGTRFLPRILGEFRKQNPQIKLEIIETGGISALQMVEEEKLDIALTNYTTGFSQKLLYQKLYDCECCFVTYPDHPLAKRRKVSFDDFADEPLVMLDSHFFIYRMVQDLFAEYNCKPNIIHYSPYLHTIKNLVESGICSTFLARQAVLPSENLVPISLEKPFYINSGIVTKKSRQVYEDEKLLIDYLQKIAQDMEK
ncbi:LysR family transcriptional regulator [Mitsuokella sp.]|uniref:LysR family transcriptional regulator n=1 Tax=unclassified Mitsuokella TaxID=2637239 RepID=UPI003D7E3914